MEPSNGVRASVFVVCLLPQVAFSSSAITEAEAVRLFLEESPQARGVPLAARSADAESRFGTRVANPEVAYEIEDAAGVRDEFLTFRQELPVSGRRGLLRERAAAASSAAGLAANRGLQEDAHALRLAFHEVLYREGAVDSLLRGFDTLARMLEILRERERQGEGSGYDVVRAEQELAELGIARARAEAALTAARSGFGAFFDAARNMESATLSGDFATTAPDTAANEAIELALSKRIELRALSAQEQSRELEYRGARRRRYPEPTVTAGWKRVDALGMTDTGFVASLTVPLPLFDRGRLEATRARADLERLELDGEILERRIRAEVRAAAARFSAAREAARRYGQEVEHRARDLRRIARLSYDEGENGILELLDAHRTSLAMELRALAARHEAKSAEIELDRAIGFEVTP